MGKKSKTTPEAQEFISKKIRKLKDEGKFDSHEQEIAVALSMARKEGYDVPENPNKKKAAFDAGSLRSSIDLIIGELRNNGYDDAAAYLAEYKSQNLDIGEMRGVDSPREEAQSESLQRTLDEGRKQFDVSQHSVEEDRKRPSTNKEKRQLIDETVKKHREETPMPESQKLPGEAGQEAETIQPKKEEASALSNNIDKFAEMLSTAEANGFLSEAIESIYKATGLNQEQLFAQLDEMNKTAKKAPEAPEASEAPVDPSEALREAYEYLQSSSSELGNSIPEVDEAVEEVSSNALEAIEAGDESKMKAVAESMGNITRLIREAEGMPFAKPGDSEGDKSDGESKDSGKKKEDSKSDSSLDKEHGELKDEGDSEKAKEHAEKHSKEKSDDSDKESDKKDSEDKLTDGAKEAMEVLKKELGGDEEMDDVLKMLEEALGMLDEGDKAIVEIHDLGDMSAAPGVTMTPGNPMPAPAQHAHVPLMAGDEGKMERSAATAEELKKKKNEAEDLGDAAAMIQDPVKRKQMTDRMKVLLNEYEEGMKNLDASSSLKAEAKSDCKECPKCKCDPCECKKKDMKKKAGADEEECTHCSGYGSSMHETADKCTACGGSGLKKDSRSSITSACRKCKELSSNASKLDRLMDKVASSSKANPFWVDKGYQGLRLHDRVWRKADMEGLADSINDEPGRVVAFGNKKAIVDWGDLDGIPTEENPANLVIAERADGEATLFEVPTAAEADFKFNEEPQGAPMGSPVDPEDEKVLKETSLFDMLRKEAGENKATSEDEVRHVATGKRGRVTARLSNGQMKVMVDGKELTLWSYEVS